MTQCSPNGFAETATSPATLWPKGLLPSQTSVAPLLSRKLFFSMGITTARSLTAQDVQVFVRGLMPALQKFRNRTVAESSNRAAAGDGMENGE